MQVSPPTAVLGTLIKTQRWVLHLPGRSGRGGGGVDASITGPAKEFPWPSSGHCFGAKLKGVYTFWHRPPVSNYTEIRSVGSEIKHARRRTTWKTDMQPRHSHYAFTIYAFVKELESFFGIVAYRPVAKR
jgi:hypothetical protein